MFFQGDRVRDLTLQKRTTTYDDYNQPVETWSDDAAIYGEKWERQGKEALQDGQIAVTQDIRFKVRYFEPSSGKTIEADYRIKEGSDIYDIQNKQEIGRREGWWLMCKYRDNE